MTKKKQAIDTEKEVTKNYLCFDFQENKILEKNLPDLRSKQDFVEGYIEGVRIGENLFMYVNEEGSHQLDHAPVLFEVKNGKKAQKHIIFGNIIFLKLDENGDSYSPTLKELKNIKVKRATALDFHKGGFQ